MERKRYVSTAIKAVMVAGLIHTVEPPQATAGSGGSSCNAMCQNVGGNCVGAPMMYCDNTFGGGACGYWNPPSCYDSGGGVCDDSGECDD
jgi:hypothetical protein